MGYVPVDTVENLHVELGHVGTGDMTSGSGAITIGFTPLPWQVSADPLTGDDVGRRISVIGAGPNAPIVPAFGPPGKMLVTTVQSVSDGAHATLTDSASNNTQSGASNTVLYRPVRCQIGSLNWDANLTTPSRQTVQVTFVSPDGTMLVYEGMPILIWHDTLGDLFGGQIQTVKVRNSTGVAGDPLWFECECVSWAIILDRRIVNPHILNGGVFSGDIKDVGEDLIYNYCDSEGLSTDFATGVDVDLPNQAGTTAAATLDELVKQASTTTSYIWYVTPWRVVTLKLVTAVAAPWNVSEADDSDQNVLVEIAYTRTRDKLANYIFDDETGVLKDPIVETFKGNIGTNVYSTSQHIGSIQSIKINGVTQSFGISGKTGVDWWWNQNSNTLTQNRITQTIHGNGSLRAFEVRRPIVPIVGTGIAVVTLNGNPQSVGATIQTGKDWYAGPIAGATSGFFTAFNALLGTLLPFPLTPNNAGARNVLYQDTNTGTHPTLTSGDTLVVNYGTALLDTETLEVTYQPQAEQVFFAVSQSSIDARAGLESGTGIWGAKIQGDTPTQEADCQPKAQLYADTYGNPPITFELATFKPGLAPGQVQHIRFNTMGIEGDFLIEQVTLSISQQFLKWSYKAVAGALIGDWRSAFSKDVAVLGGGSTSVPPPIPTPTTPTSSTIPPYMWAPGYVAPITGDALDEDADGIVRDGFGIQPIYKTLADGTRGASVSVKGTIPINIISPIVDRPVIDSATLGTSGSIPEMSFLLAAVSFDEEASNRVYGTSDFSDPAAVDVPAGGTGSVDVIITWPDGAHGGDLYASIDGGKTWHFQEHYATGVTTHTLTAIYRSSSGGPNPRFDHFAIYPQEVKHSGVLAAQVLEVTATTLKLAGAAFDTDQWAGRCAILLAHLDTTKDIEVAHIPIESNDGDTLTVPSGVEDLTNFIDVGDLVTISSQPTAQGDDYYTDDNWVNSFGPSGLATDAETGRLAFIYRGTGMGQAMLISGNDSTKITLARKWDINPDSTSVIMILSAQEYRAFKTRRLQVPNKITFSGIVAEPNIVNLAGGVWLLSALTEDVQGNSDGTQFPPNRVVYIFGDTWKERIQTTFENPHQLEYGDIQPVAIGGKPSKAIAVATEQSDTGVVKIHGRYSQDQGSTWNDLMVSGDIEIATSSQASDEFTNFVDVELVPGDFVQFYGASDTVEDAFGVKVELKLV